LVHEPLEILAGIDESLEMMVHGETRSARGEPALENASKVSGDADPATGNSEVRMLPMLEHLSSKLNVCRFKNREVLEC